MLLDDNYIKQNVVPIYVFCKPLLPNRTVTAVKHQLGGVHIHISCSALLISFEINLNGN